MSTTNDTWCCAAARSERELTADELEHVSGGKQGGPKVPAYMDVKLKEVLVTAV